ncbi:hypothetical protein [Fusibacter bizertensis]
MGRILEAFNKSDSLNFPLDLQNMLLDGDVFKHVESISKGLPEMWNSIRSRSNQDMLMALSKVIESDEPVERNKADK